MVIVRWYLEPLIDVFIWTYNNVNYGFRVDNYSYVIAQFLSKYLAMCLQLVASSLRLLSVANSGWQIM